MALPIFVINLDRRPDRWRAISDSLGRIGLDAQRIPGVEANQLTSESGQRGPGNRPTVNAGARACILGHCKALRILLDSSHPAALVLEDDAEIASDTPSLLESTEWWPDGAGIIRLEDGHRRKRPLRACCGRTPNGRELRKLEYWIGGSAGYLINRTAAQTVLEAFASPTQSTDHTLFDLRVSRTARILQTVQIVPACVRQRGDNLTSDILPWRLATEHKGWKKRIFKMKRSLGSMPYKIKFLGLLLAGMIHRMPVEYVDNFQDK